MTASTTRVERRNPEDRRGPEAREATAEALIELRDVTKTYHTRKAATAALRGVSLDICEGEFVGLAGPSGSGKSTLLHVCGLVDQPDRGRYRLGGVDTSGFTARESALVRRDKIGFVFQTFNLVPVLSASENVELPLRLAGVPAPMRATRVADALEEVGMSGHAGHRPDELSGGQRQRVAIARALVKRPKLVIADEPTASLDGETAAIVIDLLRSIGRQCGATVLVATHDPRVTSRCDRVVTLVDGAVS